MTDLLSDILSSVTVVEARLVRFESAGPFALRFEADGYVKFGAVISGQYSLWLDGDTAPIRLTGGDCFVLTGDRSGRAFDVESVPEIDSTTFCAESRGPGDLVRLGTGEAAVVVIGGQMMLDQDGAAWLRETLPPLIHIAASALRATSLRATIGLLKAESEVLSPGGTLIAGRLAEILLMQIIRAHLEAHPGATHRFAGLTDRQIGRALQEFHADPAMGWTVAALAKAAGMSRSSFSERFRARMGLSPLDYVARWRLYRVRRDLLETDLPFATIAYRNGYASRSSCSQAFKKMFGQTPSQWRGRARRDASPAP